MNRFGTVSAGFAVDYVEQTRTVVVEAWGFWDTETSEVFDQEVLKACADSGAEEVLLDAQELKPLRDEGQEALATVLQALPRLKILRVSVRTGSQLTKLQLLRLAKRCPAALDVTFR